MEKGKENLMCRLKKSLYGLKQDPRQWYKKFESFMMEHKFQKTQVDHCVFVKRYDEGDFLILLLYVDDMLIVGQDTRKITILKNALGNSFAMKDLGPAKQILGMHIVRDRTKKVLWLSQEKYVTKILERFNMSEAKPVGFTLPTNCKLNAKQCRRGEKEKAEMRKVPYASAVGSLMYAMVCTRPDIAFVVGAVSRYMSNPGREHWAVVKWILRYLKGTSKVYLSWTVCVRGIYRFGHVGGCRLKSIHFWVRDDLRMGSSVVGVKTTEVCGLIDHRGRVYGSGRGQQRTDLDEEFPQ